MTDAPLPVILEEQAAADEEATEAMESREQLAQLLHSSKLAVIWTCEWQQTTAASTTAAAAGNDGDGGSDGRDDDGRRREKGTRRRRW